MKPIIEAENISKIYKLGETATFSLRDSCAKWWEGMTRRKQPTATKNNAAFAALSDISFNVNKGEIVGIVGRNGAGKSTLLKILAKITEPTSGRAILRGRVASLLEVGTGFHPDLTGRENIYLNGAILGMRKYEISKKFDEITAFAEVEKFIDTPVKHYSSGMYVRLAFAVAAQLEPEILLVDEILAVGDAAFQKKCLGKMGEVSKQGRTVLFVNHNIGQLRKLCSKGLLIEKGKVAKFGTMEEVAGAYQAVFTDSKAEAQQDRSDFSGFTDWKILNPGNENPHQLTKEGELVFQVKFLVTEKIFNGYHGLILKNGEGQNVGGWSNSGMKFEPGEYILNYRFPYMPLRPGNYYWHLYMWDGARRVDVTYLHPPLQVVIPEHSNQGEASAGILNIPWEISFRKSS